MPIEQDVPHSFMDERSDYRGQSDDEEHLLNFESNTAAIVARSEQRQQESHASAALDGANNEGQ